MPYKAGRCLLSDRLKEADMTPLQLSEKTGIALSQLSEYLHSKRTMSFSNAKTIAEAVGCSMDDLYEWIHIPVSQKKKSRHQGERP
jgi:transcriptional regulator with XRE-family HTH domain